jgi:hypothetical protein
MGTVLRRPYFLQWATLVFRAPAKPAYWRWSSLASFFHATTTPGRQDLRSPSTIIPLCLQLYLISAGPHGVITAAQLPIQMAAEIKASQFHEDEAEE